MSSLLYGTFREPLTDRPARHAIGAPPFGVFQSKLRSLDPRPRPRRRPRPRSVGVFWSEKSPIGIQLRFFRKIRRCLLAPALCQVHFSTISVVIRGSGVWVKSDCLVQIGE